MPFAALHRVVVSAPKDDDVPHLVAVATAAAAMPYHQVRVILWCPCQLHHGRDVGVVRVLWHLLRLDEEHSHHLARWICVPHGTMDVVQNTSNGL